MIFVKLKESFHRDFLVTLKGNQFLKGEVTEVDDTDKEVQAYLHKYSSYIEILETKNEKKLIKETKEETKEEEEVSEETKEEETKEEETKEEVKEEIEERIEDYAEDLADDGKRNYSNDKSKKSPGRKPKTKKIKEK